jgi:hypothetical protein
VKSSNCSNDKADDEGCEGNKVQESEELENELIDDIPLNIPLNLEDKDTSNCNFERINPEQKKKRLRKLYH